MEDKVEMKKIYVYQLSLANGKILINNSEGMFSVGHADQADEKVLINSATLINILYEDEAGNVIDANGTVVRHAQPDAKLVSAESDINDSNSTVIAEVDVAALHDELQS